MKQFALIAGLFASVALAKETAAPRLLTIGGAVSETVCALGECDRIVATDVTSVFPEKLKSLPQVGYIRNLNAEGLLAQKADLIITTPQAGPTNVLDKVKATGTKVQTIDGGITVEAARSRIIALGEILNHKPEADALAKDLDKDLKALEGRRAAIKTPVKALFVYARGPKVLQVSGDGTSASIMLELAGAKNAVTGFHEYKPLTPEAAVAAAPEVIVMTRDGAASIGGEAAVWELPGLKMTPAFKNKRLIMMDDLFLLGMGPRLGKAATQLMDELYPTAPLSRK